MISRYQKTKGFTLIELLVVISIISLLSSVVLSSLSSVRSKARDARRMSDLRQIKIALELYRANDPNNNYPTVTGWANSKEVVYLGVNTWAQLQTALAPYLPQLPVDPINNAFPTWTTGNYSYTYGYNTGTSYSGKYDLIAQLENTSSPYRCYVRGWLYHTAGGETPWCQGTGTGGHGIITSYSFSPYLYADH